MSKKKPKFRQCNNCHRKTALIGEPRCSLCRKEDEREQEMLARRAAWLQLMTWPPPPTLETPR